MTVSQGEMFCPWSLVDLLSVLITIKALSFSLKVDKVHNAFMRGYIKDGVMNHLKEQLEMH